MASCLACDCNDAEASVYPGATELCDGVDNDCNGSVDDRNAVAQVDPGLLCRGDLTDVTVFADTNAQFTADAQVTLERSGGGFFLPAVTTFVDATRLLVTVDVMDTGTFDLIVTDGTECESVLLNALEAKTEAECELLASCGDGIRNAPEECDDGNTADGDCCSAICTFEPAASSCDDGLACNTGETCDGAGVCAGGSAPDCSLLGDQCNTASCNPGGAEGNCDTFSPVSDGTFCDERQRLHNGR